MTQGERREIVEHAVRWCSNILVEVLHNHGAKTLSADELLALHEAVERLARIGR